MKDEHTAWCQNQFDIVSEGGAWAVPRSGLIFSKQDGKFVLTLRMPHSPDMPMTPEELRVYQQGEFELIRRKFAEAGIEVIDTSMEI